MASLLDMYTQAEVVPTSTHSDQERYEWIRGHRGDPVIDYALASSDFDSDFDRYIDAAIEISKRGERQPLNMRVAVENPVGARRRGEASHKVETDRPARYNPSDTGRFHADDWMLGKMGREPKVH